MNSCNQKQTIILEKYYHDKEAFKNVVLTSIYSLMLLVNDTYDVNIFQGNGSNAKITSNCFCVAATETGNRQQVT